MKYTILAMLVSLGAHAQQLGSFDKNIKAQSCVMEESFCVMSPASLQLSFRASTMQMAYSLNNAPIRLFIIQRLNYRLLNNGNRNWYAEAPEFRASITLTPDGKLAAIRITSGRVKIEY